MRSVRSGPSQRSVPGHLRGTGCGAASMSVSPTLVVGARGQVPDDSSLVVERGGEAVVVDPTMVVPAEEGRVAEVGGAPVAPVTDVVRVGPLGGSPTAGDRAAAVA